MRYLIALFISFLFVAPVSAQVSCDSATVETSMFIDELAVPVAVKIHRNHPPVLEPGTSAWRYRTLIRLAARTCPVNFGDRYVLLHFGNAMESRFGYLIDALTGEVIPLPQAVYRRYGFTRGNLLLVADAFYMDDPNYIVPTFYRFLPKERRWREITAAESEAIEINMEFEADNEESARAQLQLRD